MNSSFQALLLDQTLVKLPKTGEKCSADIEAMYQSPKKILEDVPKEESISIENSGRLFSSASSPFEESKKNYESPTLLQEKRWTIPENKAKNLSKEFEKAKSEDQFSPQHTQNGNEKDNSLIFEMFSRFERNIFAKLDQMEERVSRLEQSSPSLKTEFPVKFDPSDSHASSFLFKSNDRIINRTQQLYSELALAQSIPKSGKLTYSFIIGQAQDRVWVGIAPIDKIGLPRWFKEGIRYYITNGEIEFTGPKGPASVEPRYLSQGYGSPGDTLSMSLDIDSGVVSFLINNYEVNLILVDMKRKSYFPFIGLGTIGDEITFLSVKYN